MTHTDTPAPCTPDKPNAARQRLRRTLGYVLLRGAAHATGTGLIGLIFWWITHH